jgi:hypothetical protein
MERILLCPVPAVPLLGYSKQERKVKKKTGVETAVRCYAQNVIAISVQNNELYTYRLTSIA